MTHDAAMELLAKKRAEGVAVPYYNLCQCMGGAETGTRNHVKEMSCCGILELVNMGHLTDPGCLRVILDYATSFGGPPPTSRAGIAGWRGLLLATRADSQNGPVWGLLEKAGFTIVQEFQNPRTRAWIKVYAKAINQGT